MKFAVNGYETDAVKSALTAPNRVVRFRYELLDRNLKYKRDLNTIESASIDFDSSQSIMRTARFSMHDENIDFLNARIRPVMGVRIPRAVTWEEISEMTWADAAKMTWGELTGKYGWAEWPLGVFVLSSPARTSSGRSVVRSIEAYDLNQTLKTNCPGERLYYRAGTLYTDAVMNLLYLAGYPRMNVRASGKTLPADIEFSPTASFLDDINELLAAIEYTPLFPDENGIFTATEIREPTENDVGFLYTTKTASIIKDSAVENVDFFSIPNRFIAVVSSADYGEMIATWDNDDADNPLSTVNRGIVAETLTVTDIADQRTLEAYVERIGREESTVEGTIEFSTALMPVHGYKDIYQFEHENLSINGYYQETAWGMELTAGGSMTHTARRV